MLNNAVFTIAIPRDVHIIARRGPEHAAFTIKEMRELLEMADNIFMDERDFTLSQESIDSMSKSIPGFKRKYKLLLDTLERPKVN